MTTQHTDRELMQQALEALNHVNVQDRVQVITALRERLAHCDRCGKKLGGPDHIHTCSPQQPVQEPVAWLSNDGNVLFGPGPKGKYTRPLYTAPQPRQWVNLTDADIHNADPNPHNRFDAERLEFGRRLEAVMREKNGGGA